MVTEHSSKTWKRAFFLSVGISAVVFVLLLYLMLDQSITLTHMSEGYKQAVTDMERLAAVFPKGYAKEEVIRRLREKYPAAFIVKDQCTIQIDGLRFEFDEAGQLINIETRALSSPDYECGR